MDATTRKRLLRELAGQQREPAERWAFSIDGGIGMRSAAAIAPLNGFARKLEVERWLRRIDELGLDQIAYVILPGEGDPGEIEAHTELVLALRRRRGDIAA